MHLVHKFIRKFHLRRLLSKTKSAHFSKTVYTHPNFDGTDLRKWIIDGINGYKQWYQPVDFVIARADVTTPPDWKPQPEKNEECGLGRWNFIIKKNLPDVTGKRILDVGCNVGLYSIELAKMGAAEVIGIDRTMNINHGSDFPPKQDIVSQANFVKEALERINKVKYPVIYKGINFNNYTEIIDLGKFDFVLALNVVYHEYERSLLFLNSLSKITDVLLLQTSIGHKGELAKWANIPKQTEMLIKAGFTSIFIDYPKNYSDPLIVAKK